METVLSHIEKNRKSYIDRLVELLRLPSVSADPAYKQGIDDCADHVKAIMVGMGLEAKRVDTEGHPIVYGEYTRPENKRTLIVYGHYDVQPVDPLDLWTSPPFEPRIEGDKIYARGATDDKGQFLLHLLAAEAFLKTRGTLPVNLKFIIEGEEEVASANLEDFVREHRDDLKADGVVVSDGVQYGPGLPAVTYSLRGIAAAELSVHGPAMDLHSGGFGGALANPATELARIIAAFHDKDHRVAIPGFYDQVLDIEDWEREIFAGLPFDDRDFLDMVGSPSVQGEKGYSTLERIGARPTCEVNGLYGGYAGDGMKTIVPAHAGCKITCRLVPDQDPHDILDKLKRHVEAVASPGVRVELKRFGGAKPVVVSRDNAIVKSAVKAMEKGFGIKPVFRREGGSIPIINVFKEVLGLDTLLLGFGLPDDNAHSPDEKFTLSDFQKGIVTAAHLFEEAGLTP